MVEKQINISIKVSGSSSVVVLGRDINLGEWLPRGGRVVAVVDSRVMALYGARFGAMEVIEEPSGEDCKSFSRVERLIGRFIELGVDRGSFILAVGGGTICDMVGFAASVFMRGVEFGFVSTTLLSQVDASVGGKNGVNVGGYKNMAGVFAQPSFVICDSLFLGTLTSDLMAQGMAEVIKAALICDAAMFEKIERDGFSYDLVSRAVEIKAHIVERDFREQGDRRLLNLGHTFGHAIEKLAPDRYNHGQAVAVGLCLSAELSCLLGMIDGAKVDRVRQVVRRFGLPDSCHGLSSRALVEAMCSDKKRVGEKLNLVLLADIGRAEVVPLAVEELENLIPIIIKK